MAVYTRRKVVTNRVEYVLPSPTNWVEVGKVTSVIADDLSQRGLSESDDRVCVEARDDEIVFSFEVPSDA